MQHDAVQYRDEHSGWEQTYWFVWGRTNSFQAMGGIMATNVGFLFTPLAWWVWLGDIKCMARLAAVCSTSNCTTRMYCHDCPRHPVDRERRIVIPHWVRDIPDIVDFNKRCWHCSRLHFRTYYGEYTEHTHIDQVVKAGMWITHKVACNCTVCQEGVQRYRKFQ
jgi:hypothetical protein